MNLTDFTLMTVFSLYRQSVLGREDWKWHMLLVKMGMKR